MVAADVPLALDDDADEAGTALIVAADEVLRLDVVTVCELFGGTGVLVVVGLAVVVIGLAVVGGLLVVAARLSWRALTPR